MTTLSNTNVSMTTCKSSRTKRDFFGEATWATHRPTNLAPVLHQVDTSGQIPLTKIEMRHGISGGTASKSSIKQHQATNYPCASALLLTMTPRLQGLPMPSTRSRRRAYSASESVRPPAICHPDSVKSTDPVRTSMTRRTAARCPSFSIDAQASIGHVSLL